MLRAIGNLLKWLMRTLQLGPCDIEVGSIARNTTAELKAALRGKTALVVGGTKGIGRGIATVLAESGCTVHIVGRDEKAGRAQVEKMKQAYPEGKHHFFEADLSQLKGCGDFGQQAKMHQQDNASGGSYDFIALTVGAWPDWKKPKTVDGFDKVLHLDIFARYALLKSLADAELLCGANSGVSPVVLNVLASGMRDPPFFSHDLMKSVLKGEKSPDYTMVRTMATAGIAGDAMLKVCGKRFPDVTFVGTFPGLIASTLAYPTIGEFLAKLMFRILRLLQVDFSEDEVGLRHCSVLAALSMDKLPTAKKVFSFEVLTMTACQFSRMSQDTSFCQWLEDFLQASVSKKM